MTEKKQPAPKRKATPSELGAAALFLCASLLLVGTLVQRRLETRPPPSVDPLAPTTTLIVPTEAQEGVTVTPGPARLLSVGSTPEGAAVLLDGTRRGETPFSTDFECEPGKHTVLEVDLKGYRRERFQLECANGSTRVSVTLKRKR